MRMKRLEIYGYGKWVDTTFNLAKDVHLFHGVNEAGKSTLMSFIHSILFGFPTRNSTLLRYEPRESSRYGGKIVAEDARFGEVIIERIHGKVTGNVTVTLEDGTTGTDELLDTVLYGMERETFQNIFSFSLSDIEQVHQLSKNELSRYLLNIGAHGTERYLDLVDQFRADADKLYRPSGRVLDLNKQLSVLEKQEQRLAELEERNESYLGLLEQNNAENKEIETFEKKEQRVEAKRANLLELKKQWPIFEEMNTLKADIAKIKLPPLKEDGRYLLDEYKREASNIHGERQRVEREESKQKQTLAEPELIDSYQENKEIVDRLESQLPETVESLRDFESINEKRLETQKVLTSVEKSLGIEHRTKYPEAFSTDEVEKVKDWQAQDKKWTLKAEELTNTIWSTENELNLKNQKLDQYEAMMWDAKELKDVEAELQSEIETTESRVQMGPLISGLLGFVLFGSSFFVGTPFNWILGIIGVLAIILAFVLSQRKPNRAAPTNHYLEKEYERQLTLKDEWQEALGESDMIQETHQNQLQARDSLAKKQEKLTRDWQGLLVQHALPKHFVLEQADSLFEQMAQLHELLATDQTQSQEQAQVKNDLEEKTASIHQVLELERGSSYQEKVTIFRNYLNRLKAELTREQEKLDRLNALKQEMKQLDARHQAVQEKIKDLIEMAAVKTEDEFVALYKQKEIRDGKISRLKFLQENAPQFDQQEALPSKEEIVTQLEKLEKQLNELATQKRTAIRKQANTQHTIENLEKDGTYTEEVQIFENQKAIAQRLVDDWVSDKLAAGMIQETLNQVTKDRFQEIIADAQHYFHLLTSREYERIVFKEEKLFVQHRNGQVVDVRVLSRGTAEPLYVAIRLAYIKNTQDVMELPLIMDDPFVNFDRTRQQNMYELLETLSEDLQIIYFTFDEEVLNDFSDQQITKLNRK